MIINLSIYIHNERINSRAKNRVFISISTISAIVLKGETVYFLKKVEIARLSTEDFLEVIKSARKSASQVKSVKQVLEFYDGNFDCTDIRKITFTRFYLFGIDFYICDINKIFHKSSS